MHYCPKIIVLALLHEIVDFNDDVCKQGRKSVENRNNTERAQRKETRGITLSLSLFVSQQVSHCPYDFNDRRLSRLFVGTRSLRVENANCRHSRSVYVRYQSNSSSSLLLPSLLAFRARCALQRTWPRVSRISIPQQLLLRSAR